MSVLDRLSAAPGVYWGEGQGPGGGRFVARVCLQGQDDGTLTFDYEAWSPQGGLQHAESGRFARTGSTVTLAATSNGGDDIMVFREGEPGVFGSVGSQRVGLVITTESERMTFSWWWTGRDGQLREQSRAVVAPMRDIVPAPAVPGADLRPVPAPVATTPGAASAKQLSAQPPASVAAGVSPTRAKDADAPTKVPAGRAAQPLGPVREPVPSGSSESYPDTGSASGIRPVGGSDVGARLASTAAARNASGPNVGNGELGTRSGADGPRDPGSVPWPGILVLHGAGTGLVAQRLAARLTRAAVVRTDLFDRAVRGTAGRPDPALRQRIALSVVQGYAATGHPVILHGASSRREHEELVAAITRTGLRPVRLVDVADGEDYGEVARRLIESD